MADPPPPRRRRRISVRAWLRALHRDTGYLVVGLTYVYALSGLAVNHIGQWDPSFVQIDRTHELPTPLPPDDGALAEHVLAELGLEEAPADIYRADEQLHVVLSEVTLHVDTKTGTVVEEGQRPRVFLRVANWLHLNRGKKAWTYFADGYAVLLLFLATSGLFMLGGKKGLFGRGAIIAILGASVPILYIALSGGP